MKFYTPISIKLTYLGLMTFLLGVFYGLIGGMVGIIIHEGYVGNFMQRLSSPVRIAESGQVSAYYDVLSPVIIFDSNEVSADSSEETVELKSSEELDVSDKEDYSIEFISQEDIFYRYLLVLKDIRVGSQERTIAFLDLIGNQTGKVISINREDPLVLGASDSNEKVWRNGDDLLAVVDKEFSLLDTYWPKDLVDLGTEGIPVTSGNRLLREVVIKDLKRLFRDAQKEGHQLYVLSAYRSYQKQIETYNYWVRSAGQSEADRASAKPGHSEHQLGTTIDFTSLSVQLGVNSDFGQTPEGKWLAENAYKYGFVMSYPEGSEDVTGYKYEPWHFRYVGTSYAERIYKSGTVPVEYLKKINWGEDI